MPAPRTGTRGIAPPFLIAVAALLLSIGFAHASPGRRPPAMTGERRTASAGGDAVGSTPPHAGTTGTGAARDRTGAPPATPDAASRREHDALRARSRLLAARSVAAALALRGVENREAEAADQVDAIAARRDAGTRAIGRLETTLIALGATLDAARREPLASILVAPVPLAAAPASLLALDGLAAGIAARIDALRRAEAADRTLGTALAAERVRLDALHGRASARARAVERDRADAAEAAARADATEAAAAAAAAAARSRAVLASRSATLHDAVAKLAAGAPAPPAPESSGRTAPAPASPLPAARATVDGRRHRPAAPGIGDPDGGAGGGASRAIVPVAGRVMQRFGAATDAGPSTGLTYGPPPSALVSAPCRGVIDFAGPFRSYGHMIIIDCGHDERFVLAGLARLDATAGENVRAGEPVGRMPDFNPGGAGSRPTLYVQLRRGTRTVDPAIAFR